MNVYFMYRNTPNGQTSHCWCLLSFAVVKSSEMTTMLFAASLSNVLFQSSTIFSPPSHICPVVERTDMLLKEIFSSRFGASEHKGGGALQPSTIIGCFRWRQLFRSYSSTRPNQRVEDKLLAPQSHTILHALFSWYNVSKWKDQNTKT